MLSAKSFIFLFLFSLSYAVAFAVPAYPYLIKKIQPNGDTINIKMMGDERIKWMESEDGFSLLYNESKFIVFATKNQDGDMIPSNIIAKDVSLRSNETNLLLKEIPTRLEYSNKQKIIFKQLGSINDHTKLRSDPIQRSALGRVNAICALMEFQDKSFIFSREDFDLLMNQIGYVNGIQQGSVRDYYFENSYGQLELSVTVVGPFKAQHNHSYYGENNRQGYDQKAYLLAKEAADFTFGNTDINPEDYDNDGDGFIDTFHFIYAGYGEEAGGGDDCIWAHKSQFSTLLQYKNKKILDYSCSPELRESSGSNMTYIGVICHEVCHLFGAPDYYDTDGSGSGGEFSGTGNWDLMGSGSWNYEGARPAHINMYQKIRMGWVDPVILSSPISINNMPNSAENPIAYIVETNNSEEYYVLENRQKWGFDSYIPGTGLLIYHVSITEKDILDNNVNNKHPQKMYPVAAHSSYSTPTGSVASYGSVNSRYTPFPSYDNYMNSEFSDTSTPSSTLWSGEPLGKPLLDIKQEKQLISFSFLKRKFDFNLQAKIIGNKVYITWEEPVTDLEIAGYNIYRNGEFILSTTNTVYREDIFTSGSYTYGISAKHNEMESVIEEVTIEHSPSGIDYASFLDLQIYPTILKSGDILNIVLNNEFSEAFLHIYSLSGQILFEKEMSSPLIQLSIDLPAGLYIARVIYGHNSVTTKLIIE